MQLKFSLLQWNKSDCLLPLQLPSASSPDSCHVLVSNCFYRSCESEFTRAMKLIPSLHLPKDKDAPKTVVIFVTGGVWMIGNYMELSSGYNQQYG
ncbi:hypothetical protein L2E82_22453 [Cichorium intybus]|uniref:Uncharacterized protein n=1 Tax=Cichorium intybus TaxID=13427 RepID=A0ACB9DXL3_CICIN|nr:hypothetical protein L2E82_22453 [Cichorium intybus]